MQNTSCIGIICQANNGLLLARNDFKEIKDVYDAIQANLDDNVITAEKRQQGQINDNESITTNEDGSVIIKNP